MKLKTSLLLTLAVVFLALAACHTLVKPNAADPTFDAKLETDITDDVTSDVTALPSPPKPTPIPSTPEPVVDLFDELLPIEFSSATEQYSLRHPVGWVIEADENGLGLVLANSEAALTRFNVGQVDSGDFVLNIGFIPATWFERFNIQLGTPPDIFLQSIMPLLRPTSDTAEHPVVSDSKLVHLSNDIEAGLLTVSDDKREGRLIVFEVKDRIFVFITASGYPGEVGDFQEIALAIAANIKYTGSAQDLSDVYFDSEN